MVAIEQLKGGRLNPRKEFREDDLAELADSIRVKGLGAADPRASRAPARIAARGLGFEHDREGLATMAVASLVGRGVIDLAGPVFATAELGAEVPLSRPAFAADDGAMVYRVAPVSVVAALGAGVRF